MLVKQSCVWGRHVQLQFLLQHRLFPLLLQQHRLLLRLRMTQSIYGNHPYFLLVDRDAHLEKTDEREPALLTSSLVCPLRKAIYGLNRQRRFSTVVIQAGFARSDHDSAMFVSVYPRGRAIQLLYVDDIKLTGDYSVTISLIKCRLHQLFAMKALTRPKPFLGLEVAHSPRGYLVSQIK